MKKIKSILGMSTAFLLICGGTIFILHTNKAEAQVVPPVYVPVEPEMPCGLCVTPNDAYPSYEPGSSFSLPICSVC